jgi:hypothetical protein
MLLIPMTLYVNIRSHPFSLLYISLEQILVILGTISSHVMFGFHSRHDS